MANHVYTIMCITSTPEVLKAFKDKIVSDQKQSDNTDKDSVLSKWYDECYRLADNLYELIYGEEYPEEPDRDWMITNIGAIICMIGSLTKMKLFLHLNLRGIRRKNYFI
jgi:hypothetical protein